MSDRSHSRAELIAAFFLGALLCPEALHAKSQIALEACRIADSDGLVSVEARCGKYEVAENPDDPKGKRIELAVAVVPAVATKSKPDPLFLIAGGPGQGIDRGLRAAPRRVCRHPSRAGSRARGPARHRRIESPRLRDAG